MGCEMADKLHILEPRGAIPNKLQGCLSLSPLFHGIMAPARAWGVVAAAVLLVAVSAEVEVLNVTSLDAILPTTSVGHFDPAKYALPLPSNATHASGKGEASTGTITSNTVFRA